VVHSTPDYQYASVAWTGTYSSLGGETETAAAAVDVLRIDPRLSLDYFAKTLPYKNQADRGRFVEALR